MKNSIFPFLRSGRSLAFTLVVLLAASFLSGCSEDKIDAWDAKGFVWFTDTLINFTNMSEPDVPEGGQLVIPLPLTVAAKVSDRDRVVNVELTRKPSDSRTQVTLQQGVFHAGRTNDTLYVGLINSSHLDQVYDTIQVHILPGEDFDQGLKSNLYATVCLHNGYPRPAWWTKNAEFVLGYFSQLKMKVFIAVTGGTDDPRTDKSSTYWSSSDLGLQYWIYLLNDYIAKNHITYPADDPNAPGQTPSFDFRSW